MKLPYQAAELKAALLDSVEITYTLIRLAQETVGLSLVSGVSLHSDPGGQRLRDVEAEAASQLRRFQEAGTTLSRLLGSGEVLSIAAGLGEEVPWPGFLAHTVVHWQAHLACRVDNILSSNSARSWIEVAFALVSDRDLAALPSIASVRVKIDRLVARWELEERRAGIRGGEIVPAEPAIAETGQAQDPVEGPVIRKQRQPDEFVTLGQICALVNRSQKQLKRYLNDPEYGKFKMPRPSVRGRGGKPNEWIWKKIRPWLQKQFKKQLPVTLQSLRDAEGP